MIDGTPRSLPIPEVEVCTKWVSRYDSNHAACLRSYSKSAEEDWDVGVGAVLCPELPGWVGLRFFWKALKVTIMH